MLRSTSPMWAALPAPDHAGASRHRTRAGAPAGKGTDAARSAGAPDSADSPLAQEIALPPLHVLIVDEDNSVRKACAEIASRLGLLPQTAGDAVEARSVLAAQPIDLLLLDLKLPGGGGLPLLDEVRRRYPNTPIVVMTAFATVGSAVQAMRSGASDYLTKPFGMDQLVDVLQRAMQRRSSDLQARALRDQIRTGAGMGPLIGRSPAMEKLYRMISKVAFTAHPVLIYGEPGTGKELVARLIHNHGTHAARPFIPVDCGSLAPALLESELFGHVKGAFTGAVRAKEGLLAAAGNGTVFLDEISELPLDLQAKLLRALQEREVRPVGGSYGVPFAARVLAANNQDLQPLVESGRFRRDLCFRLNVVNIQLQPLRDRKGDIPLLAMHMLDRLTHGGARRCIFSDDAMRLLNEYRWPGNVRELEHAIEHAVALSSGPVIHRADFPSVMQNYHPAQAGAAQEFPSDGVQAVVSIAEMEKQAILNTIRQLKGDKLTAARLLGIGKTTLYRKLKEYGIDSGTLPEDG